MNGLEEQIALHSGVVRDICVGAPPIHKATIELMFSLRSYRPWLVTSSARSDVEPVLRAAGVLQCFEAVVFDEDVKRHKPAPDPYLFAASLLGVKTGLVFEDSDAGIASAQEAGFAVIPVADPEQLPSIVNRAIGGQLEIPGLGISNTNNDTPARRDEE